MNPDDLNLIENSLSAAAAEVRDTMLGGGLPPAPAPGSTPDAEGASGVASGGGGGGEPAGLTGRIRVAGDLCFRVELTLCRERAAALAAGLLGVPVAPEDPMVDDAFGEFANLVVGSAKAKLAGHDCSLSLPEVSPAGGAPASPGPLRRLPATDGLGPLRIDVYAAAA